MSALGIVVLGAYGLAWLVVARVIAGAIAYEDGVPDTEDWAVGLTIGLLSGLLWPLILVGWLLRGLPIHGQQEKRFRQRERERELHKREEKVAQLERELGIGE